MKEARSKRQKWLELGINGLLFIIPLFLIVDGSVELAQNSPYHPDTFILFGLLILGLLGQALKPRLNFELITD